MSGAAHDPRRTRELDSPVAVTAAEPDSLVAAVRAALLANAWPTATGVPRMIGRYHVIERVGAGGMGEVLVAEDTALGRRLAIKLVHADLAEQSEAASTRLLREAQALASVNHPNVVQVYEIGTLAAPDTMPATPLVYIGMELVEGGSLRDWLAHPRSWREVVDVLVQAGRGLQAVHDVGLVHRDVKPENVLVGVDDRVRLVDFGLARLLADPSDADPPRSPTIPIPMSGRPSWPSRLTAAGAIVGTPVYMAPEQLQRAGVDARSDQYSFCVMAWEALAGKRPFPGKSMPELVDAARTSPPPLPVGTDVPPAIWSIVRRGLSYEPSARFPDIHALVEALRLASARPRRRWALVVGGSALVLAGVAMYAGLEDRCAQAHREIADAGVVFRSESRISTELEHRIAAVEAARRDVCATHASIGDARLACLAGLDQRLAAIGEALTDGGSAAERAAFALADLPVSEWCLRERTTMAPADPRVAAVRSELDHAWAMLELGRIQSADTHRSALESKVAEIDDPALAAELEYLAGEVAREFGDPVRARDHWLHAATVAEESRHDELAADVWTALVQLAAVELADASTAEIWWRRADAAVQRLGPDPRRRRALGLRRAEVARLVGDIPTARAELDRLLADAPAIDDATAFAWAPVLLARADIAAASGDHHAALAAFRRHRELVLTHLGEAHHLAAAAHYNVGKAEVASGLNDDGRASLGRAEEIWTNGHGPDHPDLALVHVALQELEMREGSLAVAREHAESALRIRRAALPEDHVDVGLAWLGLGAAALLQGDAEAAARADAAALAVHERALGSHHPQTALVRANLAEARLAGGATASARANAAQAVADLEPIADLDPSVLAFAWRVHGSALLAAGESTEAVVALRRADALTTGDEPLEHGIVLVELLRAVSQSEPESPTIDDIATRARVVLARAQGEQADAWIRRLDHAHTSKPQEQP